MKRRKNFLKAVAALLCCTAAVSGFISDTGAATVSAAENTQSADVSVIETSYENDDTSSGESSEAYEIPAYLSDKQNDVREIRTYKAFSYFVNDEGTVTLISYAGFDNSVKIPTVIGRLPVTEISDQAFMGKKPLFNITLPAGLKKIGSKAFAGCTRLKEITIPSGIEYIADDAFGNPEEEGMSLKKITGIGNTAAQTFAEKYGIDFNDIGIPTGLTLSQTSVEIKKGKTYTISGTVSPSTAADKTLKWTTSDSTIANVKNGIITAVGTGSAVISAETSNGITAVCSVTVIPGITPSLKLNKTSVSIGKNESYTLVPTLKSDSDEVIKWNCSDKSIVRVNGGKITGYKTGTATVKAYTASGLTASCTVFVKSAPKTVSLSKSVVSLGLGENFELNAVLPSGTAAAVRTFSSSNENVVKMTKTDWKAQFKAAALGTATVSVKLYNGVTASCTVNVRKAPSSISLSSTVINMRVGETSSLSSIIPADCAAANRVYICMNSTVIKMTKSNWTAEFKALKTGTTTIRVSIYNGKTADCKIVVSNAPKIYLSPSNQYANTYSYGFTNEMEQCNRIADATKIALERCGFIVKKAPKLQDMFVSIDESNSWGADLHMPIHTNAGGGAGTMCMVYKRTAETLKYAEPIYRAVQAVTPGKTNYGVQEYPKLNELKRTNKIAVYTEVDFHDNPMIAKWIIENPKTIAEAFAKGVCEAYGYKYIAP